MSQDNKVKKDDELVTTEQTEIENVNNVSNANTSTKVLEETVYSTKVVKNENWTAVAKLPVLHTLRRTMPYVLYENVARAAAGN